MPLTIGSGISAMRSKASIVHGGISNYQSASLIVVKRIEVGVEIGVFDVEVIFSCSICSTHRRRRCPRCYPYLRRTGKSGLILEC